MNSFAFYIASTLFLNTVTCIGSPITCYNCIGDSCRAQLANLPQLVCPHNCCFASTSKTIMGSVNVRGCADEEIECDKFCADHRETMMFTGKDVVHCNSCNRSLCNDDELVLTTMCYKCVDCNVAGGLVDVVECTGGCYVEDVEVVVKGCVDICTSNACMACYTDRCNSGDYADDDDRNLGTVGKDGKIKLETGDGNSRKIKTNIGNDDNRKMKIGKGDNREINMKIAKDDNRKIQIGKDDNRKMITVNDNEKKEIIGNNIGKKQIIGNNDKTEKYDARTIKPVVKTNSTEIECLECRHCNEISDGDRRVTCASPACCYEALVTDEPGDYLFTVRGCNTWGECDYTCDLFESAHLKNHTGGTIDLCIPCVDEGDDCNKNDYKLAMAPKSVTIKCYVCEDCNNIIDADTTDCVAACCYVAVTNKGVVRGCYELGILEICDNTCNYLANNEMSSCLRCTDEIDGCNDKAYGPIIEVDKPPIVDRPIQCYACEGCNVVNAVTNRTECQDATCCFRAVIAGGKGERAVRNCYKPSGAEGCDNTCKHLLRTRKDVEYCMSCEKGEGDYCNDIEYHPSKMAINCYSCENCNVVGVNTTIIRCPRADCCYKYISKKPNADFAIRGCGGAAGRRCKETCKILKEEDETLQFCMTCTENDTDLCNQNDYYPVHQRKRKFIMCYNCTNCNRVYRRTAVVKCKDASCCYKAILKNHEYGGLFTSRGCVAKRSCENTCGYVKERHLKAFPDGSLHICMTCDKFELDRCNGNDYSAADKRLVSDAPVQCYTCWHCNYLDVDTPWIMCKQAGCCYWALIKNAKDEKSFVIRGCADVEKCALTCYGIRRRYTSTLYTVSQCVVCASGQDLCNREHYHSPQIKFGREDGLRVETIKCFSCHHCNVVDSFASTVRCQVGCCYHSAVRDVVNAAVYALRGCAAVRPDESCSDACTAAKREYLLDHPGGVMLFCMSCNGGGLDGCNSNDYHAKEQSGLLCYVCQGCTVINKPTRVKKCTGACYRAIDLDGLVIRGCAKLGTCEDAGEEYAFKHTGKAFESCTVCKEDRCNEFDIVVEPLVEYLKQDNASKSAPQCYECDHCNKINRKTPIVTCSSSKCCYKAGVKDHKHDTVYAKRGCAKNEFNTEDGCDNPCYNMERKFLLNHPHGSVEFCTACKEETQRNAICNSNQYHPMQIEDRRSVQCYTCYNCNHVTRRETKLCIWPSCCYHAVVNKMAGEELFSIRGCYKLKINQTCFDTCLYLRDIWMNSNEDGMFKYCLTCNEHDSTLCNRNDYHPLKAPKKLEPLRVDCYSCSNCHNVNAYTPTKNCRDSECCFKAIVKDHAGDSYYPIRGCYETEEHESCHLTCLYVERNHLRRYGDGEMFYCDTCKEVINFCNSNAYRFRRNAFMTPTLCYNCTHCDVITKDTPVVVCPFRTCCYTVILRDYWDTALYTIRGCTNLSIDETCLDACTHVTRNHLERYWEGGQVSLCMTCNEDDADRCNKNDYNAMHDDADVNAMRCYSCRRCNKVTKYTQTVYCRSSECCYYALVYDLDNEPPFVERGCTLLEPHETCDHACLLVRRSHILRYPLGGFKYCLACTKDETSGCNNGEYTTDVTATIAPMICYQCRDCNLVDVLTPAIICSRSECCYNAVVKEYSDGRAYVIRGCKELGYGETCENTCRLVHVEELKLYPEGDVIYCLTCSARGGHKCNRNNFNLKSHTQTQVSKSTFITCYACDGDCNIIDDKTPKILCSEPECCFRALVTLNANDLEMFSRGCVTLGPGKNCKDDASAIFAKKHTRTHVGGRVIIFLTCHKSDGDDCNKDEYHGENIAELVRCYKCKDDECATTSPKTTYEICSSSCCYSVLLQRNNGRITLERGCAPTNIECHRYCTILKADHKIKHSQGSMLHCDLCSTNKCNTRKFNLKPNFPLPGLTSWKTDSGPVHCYTCTNCYQTPPKSALKFCPYKCCYTLISTEHKTGITHVERQCLHINDTYKCENYCLDTTRRFEGGHRKNIVHRCNVCGTNGCNDGSYHIPVAKTRKERSLDINCYECRDCETVQDQNYTMPCASECCYSAVVGMGAGEYQTERRCASESEIPCDKSCSLKRIQHDRIYPRGTVFDCVLCSTDLCNDRIMKTPVANKRTRGGS